MAQAAPRAVRTQVRDLFRDPVLRGMLVLTGLAWLLFLVFTGHPLRQVQVYWAAQVPLDAALAIGAWRLRCLAAQHYQRFWSMITIAGTAFTIGDSYQFLCTLFVPGEYSTSGGAVQTALFTVGMSCNVVACLIFPQGPRSGREKLVFWLDATTV